MKKHDFSKNEKPQVSKFFLMEGRRSGDIPIRRSLGTGDIPNSRSADIRFDFGN